MKRIFTLLLALPPGLAAAQPNFLVNGDFGNGLAGWTGSGDGGPLGVVPFDTNGAGADPAFGIYPGGTVYAPPHAPYLLKQQILAVPNVPLELHLDACLTVGANNAQGGYMKFSIGGVVLADWPEFSGSVTPGTFRRHLVLTFSQQLVGPHDFALEFWREKYSWGLGRTPALYVDNVRLTLAANPVLRFPGERRLGGNLGLELAGTAGDTGFVLVAPKEGPAPVTLPGFTGNLLLFPAGLQLLGPGVLDPAGLYKLSLSIPSDPAIAGILLNWQGVAVAPTLTGGFSHLHKVCVYP